MLVKVFPPIDGYKGYIGFQRAMFLLDRSLYLIGVQNISFCVLAADEDKLH